MVWSASPVLERVERDGLVWFSDPVLAAESGVLVAFSTRLGGVSRAPYDSLDLAAHTGDDPAAVDENRRRFLQVMGLDPVRLVTSEQVHGEHVETLGAGDAGRGAFAARGAAPVPGTDAMITAEPGLPLLMMYADCVPVVIVVPGPPAAVAVVHAGWRGALAGLPGIAAGALAELAGCPTDVLTAYVGPHIGPCHYEVDPGLAAAFHDEFAAVSHSVSIAAAEPRVDLGHAVSQALTRAGLRPSRITKLGLCTPETSALFYSYRGEGLTGRHGALAAIIP